MQNNQVHVISQADLQRIKNSVNNFDNEAEKQKEVCWKKF